MKPVQHQPRKLDDDGEQRLKLATVLIGGNRNLIPCAIRTVLDGYKGMPPVKNQSLRNHLTHVLTRKLRRAISYAQERLHAAHTKRATTPLPIMPLPEEEMTSTESS